MIIIADSGSTKTEWVVAAPNGQIQERMITEGINPFHQSEGQIREILTTHLSTLTSHHFPLSSLHFYGSGLRPEFRPIMKKVLESHFGLSEEHIEAESDLLGAARALCGREEGIACILGTGANSCHYNGQQIVANTPPLGYILGDEGSGAVIGRNFLNAIYKGSLPDSLRKSFEETFQMTMADVIQRVYREPLANRWMASLSTFISQQLPHYPELAQLIVDSFRIFFRRNVLPYQRSDLPIAATGSIAFYYQPQLKLAASLEGLCLQKVEQAPMEGLLRYHCPE
jgi:N-acetylglucosamine kinase-like BadF-type ATPase